MNKREILTPIGVAVVAGGLALGGIGWAAAQTLPDYPACGVPGAMGARHAQMQASLSQALGLTAEELYAELAAGRTVPQIAQERGIDLTTLHQAMQGQHQAMQGQHQASGGHVQRHGTGGHGLGVGHGAARAGAAPSSGTGGQPAISWTPPA